MNELNGLELEMNFTEFCSNPDLVGKLVLLTDNSENSWRFKKGSKLMELYKKKGDTTLVAACVPRIDKAYDIIYGKKDYKLVVKFDATASEILTANIALYAVYLNITKE